MNKRTSSDTLGGLGLIGAGLLASLIGYAFPLLTIAAYAAALALIAIGTLIAGWSATR